VVEDLEERKPKRGASCGAIEPKPQTTRPRVEERLEAEAFRVRQPMTAERQKRTASAPVSAREDNGKGAAALDERARLREERSP